MTSKYISQSRGILELVHFNVIIDQVVGYANAVPLCWIDIE